MTIVVGIPAFCERQTLPQTLASLAAQDVCDFRVVVHVNQPRGWFEQNEHKPRTSENLDTLAWLERDKKQYPFKLEVIDGVRPGLEPAGVGNARRILFQHVLADNPEAICISLDADTLAEPDYIGETIAAFRRYPNATALAAPYYHRLPADGDRALHLLRYELYMRYYQLGLWWAGSPYAFLAIGSAFSFRGRHWERSRGIPTRQAGEDFYFLQQMRKLGPVIRWINSRVYPSARVSDRVPFGTGPLMGEPDLSLQEERFPFYHPSSFQMLGQTFGALGDFHAGHFPLPMDDFVSERLGGYRGFDGMRRNFSDPQRFIRAFHEKMDGLRTLQFLRWRHEKADAGDFAGNMTTLLASIGETVSSQETLPFVVENIAGLNNLRDRLCRLEARFQKNYMSAWDDKAKW